MRYLFLILFVASINIDAQKIGISWNKLYSDNYELQDPSGYGFIASYPIIKDGNAGIEYSYYQNEREYFGFLVGGFINDPDIIEENVLSFTTLHSFDLSFIYNFFNSSLFNSGLGAGIGLLIMDVQREGLESFRSILIQEQTKFSFSGIIFIESNETFLSPASLFILGKIKASGTSTEPLDIEAPLSESILIHTIQLGINYKF